MHRHSLGRQVLSANSTVLSPFWLHQSQNDIIVSRWFVMVEMSGLITFLYLVFISYLLRIDYLYLSCLYLIPSHCINRLVKSLTVVLTVNEISVCILVELDVLSTP